MTKEQKERLAYLVLFLFSIGVVVYDFVFITVGTILGNSPAWTWFGFIGFIFAGVCIDISYDKIKDYIKK